MHFPPAWPFSCKHALVFPRRSKSPSKPSGLSGCSFISSFLFTAEVPERAVCSHRHSTQRLLGMSGHFPPPWEPCTATSPPRSFCTRPALGTAGPPTMPSSADAFPVCGAAPSLHCHPTPFPSMFGQALHPDISNPGLSSLCPQLSSTFLLLFLSLWEHHRLISSSTLPISGSCSRLPLPRLLPLTVRGLAFIRQATYPSSPPCPAAAFLRLAFHLCSLFNIVCSSFGP